MDTPTPLTREAMQTRVNLGHYQSRVAVPERRLGESKARLAARRRALDEWREDTRRLEEAFRADALAAAGLADHPRADALYAFAWEEGHGSGLAEVWRILTDLADALGLPAG